MSEINIQSYAIKDEPMRSFVMSNIACCYKHLSYNLDSICMLLCQQEKVGNIKLQYGMKRKMK